MCSGLRRISSRGPDRVPLSPAGICCGILPWGWPQVQRRLAQTLEPCEGLPPTGIRGSPGEHIVLHRPTAYLTHALASWKSSPSYGGESERNWRHLKTVKVGHAQSVRLDRISPAVLISERSSFDAVAATSSGVSRGVNLRPGYALGPVRGNR